ncbi:MAG: hypothetical protein QME12_07800 [Nanoarchaeota archaeon]|nr:hypothetical protein [Nanoarchaeota archaeon]
MKFLVTRPEHDDTTHYLSSWAKQIMVCAENHGLQIIDLNRERAVKAEFEGKINAGNPCLVMLNGHGGDNLVAGHKNEPLLIGGINDRLLKSRIVYALSCMSAKELAPRSIQSGAKCYTGYDDDFIFNYMPSMLSRPLNDERARMFFEPSNLFMKSLIKGNCVEEAKAKAVRLFKRNIAKALASPISARLAKNLWWDLKHFVSHGNLNASI